MVKKCARGMAEVDTYAMSSCNAKPPPSKPSAGIFSSLKETCFKLAYMTKVSASSIGSVVVQ